MNSDELLQEKPETFQEMIESYDMVMDNPPVNFDRNLDQNLILIRHGFSQGQEDTQFILKSTGLPSSDPVHFEARTSPQYTDTPLHELGIQQAINGQKYINEIDFEVVLVSPLKRALLTCYYMFKNHPNKTKIKFLVVPYLSEILNQTQCLASNYNELVQEFDCLQEAVIYDWSYMNNLPQNGFFWQLDQIVGREEEVQDIKEDILKQVRDHGFEEITNENSRFLHENVYQKKMYQVLEKHFVDHLENIPMVYNRVNQHFKPFLRDYIKNNKVKGKIGVVAHYVTLNVFTRSGVKDKGLGFKNASITYYQFK